MSNRNKHSVNKDQSKSFSVGKARKTDLSGITSNPVQEKRTSADEKGPLTATTGISAPCTQPSSKLHIHMSFRMTNVSGFMIKTSSNYTRKEPHIPDPRRYCCWHSWETRWRRKAVTHHRTTFRSEPLYLFISAVLQCYWKSSCCFLNVRRPVSWAYTDKYMLFVASLHILSSSNRSKTAQLFSVSSARVGIPPTQATFFQ